MLKGTITIQNSDLQLLLIRNSILTLIFKGNTCNKLAFSNMVKGRNLRSRPEGSMLPSELPTPTHCSILIFLKASHPDTIQPHLCSAWELCCSQSSKLQAKLEMHELIKISSNPTSRISDWNEFHQLYTFAALPLAHSSWLAYCHNAFRNVLHYKCMSSSQQCITIKIPTHLHLLLFKLLTATSLNTALYYNGCSARKSNRRGQRDKIARNEST